MVNWRPNLKCPSCNEITPHDLIEAPLGNSQRVICLMCNTRYSRIAKERVSMGWEVKTARRDVKYLRKQGIEIPAFKTYSEALEWIERKSNEIGDRGVFLRSDEYKAVFPLISVLHQKELDRKKMINLHSPMIHIDKSKLIVSPNGKVYSRKKHMRVIW